MKPKVLVVEDDSELGEALGATLSLAGIHPEAAASGEAALAVLEREEVDLVVSDVHMPDMSGMELLARIRARYPGLPVLLMTAYATIEQAVAAMREGAADYLVKPFEAEVLVAKASQLLRDRGAGGGELVAVDRKSLALVSLARRVAKSDATVLITGESGTGKEVLARFIHRESPRASGPFVAINCAAIPENMLEAVMFGYEKGAFTGALKACPGKFEQAHGGTLLLDEISEMALALQAKLLRVLQEKEVERLGSKDLISLDVRVLATSNCDVRRAVEEGRFREDLYYRLNVLPLRLQPLRERTLDIVPIAEQLIARAGAPAGDKALRLTPAAQERLRAYAWPGNVRELDNMLQRALVLRAGDCIDAADLVFAEEPARAEPGPASPEPASDRLGEELKVREHRLILEVLDDERGNRKAAAERLGISPRTLRYKLARMRESGIATA